MNIAAHISFQIVVYSGYMPRTGIAESYGNSIFSFLGISILFSIVAVSIYISTSSVEVATTFLFSECMTVSVL